MKSTAESSDSYYKDIIGYEGLYRIHKDGYVVSSDRIVNTVGGETLFVNGKKIKTQKSRDGYWTIQLSKAAHQRRFQINRLVAIHFIPNPNGYKALKHKNGNKLDNSVDNLEWLPPFYDRDRTPKIDFDTQFDKLVKCATSRVKSKKISYNPEILVKNALETYFSTNKDFHYKSVRKIIYELVAIVQRSEKAKKNKAARIRRVKIKATKNKRWAAYMRSWREKKFGGKPKKTNTPIHELWRKANHKYIEKQREILSDVYVRSLLKKDQRTPENIERKRQELLERRKKAA